MILPAPTQEDLRIERPRDRRALVDEAREKHYQDVPYTTAALLGGGIGATIPTALALHKGGDLDWRQVGGNATLAGLLGAVSGVGVEGVSRLLTRTVGPEFRPARWHRDQDPHRWNSLIRTAPLGVSILGSKMLLPMIMDKKQSSRYSRAAGEGATVGGAVTAGMMLSQLLRNPANRRRDAIIPGLGLLALGSLLGAGTGVGVEAVFPQQEDDKKQDI